MFFSKSEILQIYVKNGDETIDLRPVTVKESFVTTLTLAGKTFNISGDTVAGKKSYLLSEVGGQRHLLSRDIPLSIKKGEQTYYFQLAKDFVDSDSTIFKNFIIASVLLHVVLFIILNKFATNMVTAPTKVSMNVDQERVQKLLDKMKEKTEPKIAKVEPSPTPTVERPKPTSTTPPKVAEKPKAKPTMPPKVVEKPKIKQTPPPKVAEKPKKMKEPLPPPKNLPPPPLKPVEMPKRLVVEKGAERRGADRIANDTTLGGGRKLNKNYGQAGAVSAPKITEAQMVAKANAHLASKLSFLSSGSSKFVASPVMDPNAKYDKNVKVSGSLIGGGGDKNSKNYLKNLVVRSGTGGDGPIETRGARVISTGKVVSEGEVFGSNNGKALNSVQGRVAAARLYDYGKEGSFGSALSGQEVGMKVTGKGSMDDGIIEQILSKYLNKLQYCYEKSLLRDSSLAGIVTIKWKITESGQAQNAQVVKSKMNDDQLHRCITGEINKIRFPSPKGGWVEVRRPFSFTSTTL